MFRFRSILSRAATAAALFGVAGIAAAGSLEPPAGPPAPTMKTLSEVEPRIPIHQSDLPLAIMADGSYYLAENLSANQNGVDMITVFANYVSIDLNGFTINGTSQVATAADCIEIEQDVRTFALSNGTIRGCGENGVLTNTPFGVSVNVDRVQAIQNGQGGLVFGTGSYGVISRSVARSNGARGILLAEGVLTEDSAFSNGTVGLQVSFGAINGCVAHSNASLNALILSGGVSVATFAP
jgi:hypothetical protein